MSTASSQDVPDAAMVLRPAQPTDAGAMGNILYRFQQDTPWMPKLYAEVEMIAFCGVMIDRGWVTVAVQTGQATHKARVAGFLARDNDEICSLYLAAEARGQGLGHKLVEAAKAASPNLWLRVFEANTAAHRFYQRAGFVETQRRNGADIEEGLSVLRMGWRQAQSCEQAA